MTATETQVKHCPPLTWDSYDEVRDKTLPTRAERGWREIEWRTDFGSAFVEAAHKQMPVLVWAMNGDPNGFT